MASNSVGSNRTPNTKHVESSTACRTTLATLRKRRLPMEQALWLVLGVALLRDRSILNVAEVLDLALPGQGDRAISSSALSQARQRLGSEPLESLFRHTAARWAHQEAGRHRWQGLALYALDGVVWRTPDTPDNRQHFGGQRNHPEHQSPFPLVRMACLLDARARLLVDVERQLPHTRLHPGQAQGHAAQHPPFRFTASQIPAALHTRSAYDQDPVSHQEKCRSSLNEQHWPSGPVLLFADPVRAANENPAGQASRSVSLSLYTAELQPTVTPPLESQVSFLSYRRNRRGLLKSHRQAIEARWGPLRSPDPFLLLRIRAMNRHHFQPGTRAIAAFTVTVVLAVLAAVLGLLPDFVVQSADSMTYLPNQLGQLLPTGVFE